MAKELFTAMTLLKKNLKKATRTTIKGLIIKASTVHSKNKQAYWIAGGDLQELARIHKKEAAIYAEHMHAICRFIEQAPIPVIAEISGGAIGGGAELALAADIRIGNAASFFQFKQLSLGLCTGYGGGSRLVALVGKAKAQQLLYGQEIITAERAYDIGLLTHFSSDVNLEKHIARIVKDYMLDDSKAFIAQKQILSRAAPQTTSFDLKTFLSTWANPRHRKQLDAWKKG